MAQVPPWSEVVANTSAWLSLAEHLELHSYVRDGHCCTHNCTCSSSYVHFWEQVAKHDECFTQVELHENASGVRYDYVLKMRPDLPIAVLRNLSRPLLMHMRSRDVRTIWLHSNTPLIAFTPHYATTDHLALVPRRLARTYFRFAAEVSCHWIEGMDKRLRITGDMFRNEHVLAAWLSSHGATLRRLYWPSQLEGSER